MPQSCPTAEHSSQSQSPKVLSKSLVSGGLQRWVVALGLEASGAGVRLSRRGYIALCRRVHAALGAARLGDMSAADERATRGGVTDPVERRCGAEHARLAARMAKSGEAPADLVADALWQLADLWLPSTSPIDAASFLDDLLSRATRRGGLDDAKAAFVAAADQPEVASPAGAVGGAAPPPWQVLALSPLAKPAERTPLSPLAGPQQRAPSRFRPGDRKANKSLPPSSVAMSPPDQSPFSPTLAAALSGKARPMGAVLQELSWQGASS